MLSLMSSAYALRAASLKKALDHMVKLVYTHKMSARNRYEVKRLRIEALNNQAYQDAHATDKMARRLEQRLWRAEEDPLEAYEDIFYSEDTE